MFLEKKLEHLRNSRVNLIGERNGAADVMSEWKRRQDAGEIFTDADKAAIERVRATKAEADREIDEMEAAITELERQLGMDRAAKAIARDLNPQGAVMEHSSTTTRSRDVYSAERSESGERSFFVDAWMAQKGDLSAQARQAQFLADQSRATSTGSYAGLVVPQYLVEEAALIARAMRPTAEAVRRMQIPEQGMQFQVPRGTTGASATVQATENSAVSLTDEVWANVSINVSTIAGQAQPSRQSLERGEPGLDSLIYLDLAKAYATAVEGQVLSGTGASGQQLGILNTAGINQATAYTAAATAGTFTSKVAGQANAIASNYFAPPDTIVMHPRRWYWLQAQTDSQGRPLVLPAAQGPNNTLGVGDAAHAYGKTGFTFLGMDVIVSGMVPTAVGTASEDQCILMAAKEHILWEDGEGMPRELRFEQTFGQNLTVTLVAYNYIGFTAGRYPAAIGITGGNATAAGQGQIAPTF